MDEKFETETNTDTEYDTRFMPQNDVLDTNKPNEESEEQLTEKPVQAKISQTEQETMDDASNDSVKAVRYCRHCGRKVDYDSSTYCKYCGKEL